MSRKTRKRGRRRLLVIVVLLALIVLSPLLAITALAVKLDSNGPAIFKQQRLGLHGKTFWIYKFRSMCQGAEHTGTGVYSGADDMRVTRVGKLLRATSIDELPQLVNILKGDMSIVGPRPPLPKEVAQYSDWDWGRLAVRPGLTCYWQVSGRSNLSFDEWMRLDLKYIEEQGLWTDLRIIARTVGVVLRGDGAY